VQRTEWIKICFVEGAGTTNAREEYAFIDRNIAEEHYIYRLKQIDRDGKFQYYGNVGVVVGPPQRFALEQNYPNPFNPTTSIGLSLPQKSKTRVQIINTQGQTIAPLVSDEIESGVHEKVWDATNVSSGTYIYRIDATPIDNPSNRFVETKGMVLLR
jgi:Secretion system C-terminal sorting domain